MAPIPNVKPPTSGRNFELVDAKFIREFLEEVINCYVDGEVLLFYFDSILCSTMRSSKYLLGYNALSLNNSQFEIEFDTLSIRPLLI